MKIIPPPPFWKDSAVLPLMLFLPPGRPTLCLPHCINPVLPSYSHIHDATHSFFFWDLITSQSIPLIYNLELCLLHQKTTILFWGVSSETSITIHKSFPTLELPNTLRLDFGLNKVPSLSSWKPICSPLFWTVVLRGDFFFLALFLLWPHPTVLPFLGGGTAVTIGITDEWVIVPAGVEAWGHG